MRLLNQLLNRPSYPSEYSDPNDLRAIWKNYIDQWPDNNVRYHCWKPASLLPAPRWAVKRAMKLVYTELPEPIDWTVYSAFFMEFADLALHLSAEEYSIIEKFRKSRIIWCGKEKKHDPLLMYMLPLNTAYTIDHLVDMITGARDGFRRSPTWDPVDADDNELNAVHRIVVKSTRDFASLIQEWRFFTLSIGRSQ